MKYSKTRELRSPNRGTSNSAGIDLYIPTGLDQNILPGESTLIPSGVKVNIPHGTMLQVCNKSSIASKKGLIVGAEIIDSDYQGEILINLWNVSKKAVTISSGSKIAQVVHMPILLEDWEEVKEDELFKSETERGNGGFGSTGA